MPTTAFSYLWWIALGFLPSLVWLSFYLRKDSHPEPKTLLTKTFLMGIIISPLAVILQLIAVQLWGDAFNVLPQAAQREPLIMLWAAFAEEFIKFCAVYLVVVRNPAFDEPVDGMIYMITAALGFAAMENILVVFKIIQNPMIANPVNTAVSTLLLRFTGATFLHALSSALVGYFLALSWFFQHHRARLIRIGVALATLFHFTFNQFLSAPAANSNRELAALGYTITLLVIMGFLVSVLFDKIRERRVQETTLMT